MAKNPPTQNGDSIQIELGDRRRSYGRGRSRGISETSASAKVESKRLLVIFVALVSTFAGGQTQFKQADLPKQIGDYNCSFISSNVDVSKYLAETVNNGLLPDPSGANSSQFWIFSDPQQPHESVLRMDIVLPQTTTDGGNFPAASYTEQITIGSGPPTAWTYYGFGSDGQNNGRIYYGFDEPLDDALPVAMFNPPTVDIPAVVQIGQTWQRSLYWPTLYQGTVVVSNFVTVNAVVDSVGMLALPAIGIVSALRVHETHAYAVSRIGNCPRLLDAHTNDYFYWLVPGLGVAAQVTLFGVNGVNPANLPCTNTVERMFFANYFANSNGWNPPTIPPFPTNLQISLQGTAVVLNWSAFTDCKEYEVDVASSLSPKSWDVLATTTGTTWTDSPCTSHRFYRVVGTQ